MRRTTRGYRGALGAAMLGLGLVACDGILEVSDPGRFVDEDLDQALQAVADGVEGNFYLNLSYHFIQAGLLSDEYRHTGTWAPWADIDRGRNIYGNSQSDGRQDRFLQNRWFAGDAIERFERVGGDVAPLIARSRSVEAWADLILGTTFCETPLDAGGAAAPREQVLAQASSRAAAAQQLAAAAGLNDYVNANRVAQARAQLFLGNLDAAAQLAAQVPTDFAWYAKYSANSPGQNNSIVTLTTVGFNTAAGLREVYWDDVDLDAGMFVDPFTGELDARLPVSHTGNFGVDGVTPHYSQLKYNERGANIRLFSGVEARLIEAEAHWARGEHAQALDLINLVRERAGMSPHAATTDGSQVFDYLNHERFIEFFLEGVRLADVNRWGLIPGMLADGVFVGSEANRNVLFPLSQGEGLNNPNIEDNISARCLPRV
ncbi:MAG: RagB/SusD family nutrient uptake outer membrane protein [Gemmatimonadota bacterium]